MICVGLRVLEQNINAHSKFDDLTKFIYSSIYANLRLTDNFLIYCLIIKATNLWAKATANNLNFMKIQKDIILE